MKARPPQSWQLSFLLISALQYYCVAQSESSDPSPSFHPQVILSSSYQRSSSPSVHVQSQNNFIGNATLGASYNLSSQFDLSASALWMYGRVIGMGSFVASMPNGLFSWSNVKPFLGTVALSYHCICSDDSSEQISCSVGKISALAAFDLNPYANDPTTQFMNLVVLNNGAHELCAEARGGTTFGATARFTSGSTMVSVLFGAMPTEAGGIELNTDIATSHSVCAQVSTALSESAHIRLMGFMNTTTALSFSQNQAIQVQSSDPISNKFGLCLDADQKLNARWALFERLSWNDGQSESMSLTETNRSYCVGAHLERGLLDMEGQDCGAAFVLSQLSDEHAAFHRLGGESFVLSDISKYGAEVLMEAYYRFALAQHLQLTFDAQYVVNPGFERGNRPLRPLASRLSFIL